jgi:hypothetical protein
VLDEFASVARLSICSAAWSLAPLWRFCQSWRGSLHSLGNRLLQMDRAQDALKVFAEAIETLEPLTESTREPGVIGCR